jgi:hypothetical protein
MEVRGRKQKRRKLLQASGNSDEAYQGRVKQEKIEDNTVYIMLAYKKEKLCRNNQVKKRERASEKSTEILKVVVLTIGREGCYKLICSSI